MNLTYRNKIPDITKGKLKTGIIALDLDDTLLRDDLSISDYTVSVLRRKAEQGTFITMCSGRPADSILPYVRRLDLAGLKTGRFLISQNGTSILDLHLRTEIYSRMADVEMLVETTRIMLDRGMTVEVCDASTIYVPVLNAQTEKDAQLSGLKLQYIPDFENFLKRGFSKMVIPGDPEELLVLQQILKYKFGEKCSVFTSKPYYLEIQSAGAGKGEALMWLAEYLNLEPETVMAFGDSMNDETMMKLAPLSVAMVNGIDAIKQVARFVTEYSNNEDGVARFIETYTV